MTKSTGENIKYIYDAAGRKLSQLVYNASGTLTKKTDYVGEFIYQNDTLQFINHEEGRVVMNQPALQSGGTTEYQYHLKDHLGNVRMTFTAQPVTEQPVATLEDVNAVTEQSKFLRYTSARVVNSSIFDHTNNAAGNATGKAERLSGSANEKFGLARSISVMPGDVVNAEVYAKYVDPSSVDNTTTAGQNLLSLLSQIGAASAGVVIDGSAYGSSTASFPSGLAGLVTKTDDGAPKAYLNWLLFDRSYTFLTGGFKQITTQAKETGTDGSHEYITSGDITITQPGYVYIYLSNESLTPVEVYFDDFKVTQKKSPVVQMDDFYPFGLAFNQYSRENTVPQNYLYNGKELLKDLSVNWLDYGLRNYSPDIGRWSVIDSRAGKYYSHSPYNYVLNSPLINVDPRGDTVRIEVTNKVVGKTKENLYSSPEVEAGATQETKEVDAYEVNMSNELGCSATFYYTREAYRKDPNNPTADAEDRTFDVVNDNDSFQGKVRSRWSGTDNVLELRDKNNEGDQKVDAMKAGVPQERTAIQFHVKGASDGCLMAVGTSEITVNSGVTLNTQTTGTSTSSAQNRFMKAVKDFRSLDRNAGNSGYIQITFKKN